MNALVRAEARAALESAARSALRAPSVFNTQPWKWHIAGDQPSAHRPPVSEAVEVA
ncbi:hypothetical protein ACIBSW_17870 [Actinoplanes sp. NPDC049668]|uniref:hypothetical protein n=1 Tax=unclassified Actinoplanes TaxID=2626549 RepID=UPI0033A21E61